MEQGGYALETMFVLLPFLKFGGSLETPQATNRGQSKGLIKHGLCLPPPVPVHSRSSYTLDYCVRFHFDKGFYFLNKYKNYDY